MSTTPMTQWPPRPGEPTDPDLRDRYRTDASRERESRRAAAVQETATTPPSRTPVGPIRVIALLVTLALLLVAGLSLVGPMLKQSQTREQPITADGAVRFSGDVGDVRFRAAEAGERPHAVITSTWGLGKPTSSVRTSGGATRLTSSCSRPSLGTVCRVDWLVIVPADTDLTIEHGVGAVSLEGTTGDIDLQVGAGDVTITESEGDTVSADIGVGAIDYEAVEPPSTVDVRVGVGEATVRVPGTEGYRVNTSGGASDVINNIGNDSSSSRRITVESGVGSVRIDPS
ncbi:hypothetical protein ASG73_00295 [Janibacter sp. Soil728]|uniref:hypothetical protein n=1 Tax=Janibacter sp. Soil728 TaxID=1736393 RepID=UPI0006F84358|nr:hypothetical protein [Janibacter sp. Soil728]KRE38850.1 hypothetical protein ASG73_00295 [Janibacter sp. Soil728]